MQREAAGSLSPQSADNPRRNAEFSSSFAEIGGAACSLAHRALWRAICFLNGGQPDCVQHTAYPEVFVCENADPAYVPLTHPTRCPTRASAPQHTATGMAKGAIDRCVSTYAGTGTACTSLAPGSWATASTRCTVPYGGNDRAVTAWAGQTVY